MKEKVLELDKQNTNKKRPKIKVNKKKCCQTKTIKKTNSTGTVKRKS